MTPVSQLQLVQQVHASPTRLVLGLTGGGSGAICALLSTAGASRTVLEATVPYCQAALTRWIGGPLEDFCSERTGRAMAMAAYMKAQALDPAAAVVGVACTASLASDRPKRGTHRAHVAWQSAETTASYFLELSKGIRSRADEESLVAHLVLNAVAEASNLSTRLELPLVDGEEVASTRVDASPEEQELLAGKRQAVPRGSASQGSLPRVVFPGAFHPLHTGHKQMAEVAQRMLDAEVAFELSIENVDKLPLDYVETTQRTAQFDQQQTVWLTRAPTFVQKSEIFPNCTFIVGVDTLERIGQQRYYDSLAEMHAAFSQLASRGCRFLVFGRQSGGEFRGLTELNLPQPLAALCTGVPAEVFRQDISSTQIRQQKRTDEVSPNNP